MIEWKRYITDEKVNKKVDEIIDCIVNNKSMKF